MTGRNAHRRGVRTRPESALKAESSRVQEIAEQFGGEFDGWEVAVNP